VREKTKMWSKHGHLLPPIALLSCIFAGVWVEARDGQGFSRHLTEQDVSRDIDVLRQEVRELGERDSGDVTGQARLGSLHRQLGLLFTYMQDWDAAESHYLAGIRFYREAGQGSSERVASCSSALASLYSLLGRRREAEELLHGILRAEDCTLSNRVLSIYKLGLIAEEAQENAKALALWRQCLKLIDDDEAMRVRNELLFSTVRREIEARLPRRTGVVVTDDGAKPE